MGLLAGFLAIFTISISSFADCKVVGWVHNTPEESQTSADVLMQAARLARSANCAEASRKIQAHLQNSEVRLTESARVLKELEGAQVVGLEYAEAEQTEFFKALDSNLALLKKFCPQVETLSLTSLLDPAYAYSRTHASRLLPLENAEIKRQATRGIASETLNFNPDREKLSAGARALVLAAIQKTRSGQMISPSEIQKIVSEEQDPALRRKLSKVFTEFQHIQALASSREKAMAQKAARQKEITVLAGQTHAAGLRSELGRLCR